MKLQNQQDHRAGSPCLASSIVTFHGGYDQDRETSNAIFTRDCPANVCVFHRWLAFDVKQNFGIVLNHRALSDGH